MGAWGNKAGRVFVYKWNGTTLGHGDSIVGEVIGNQFGYSVSFSGNGKKLAVGAPNYDKVENETSGKKVNDSENVHVSELDF